MRFLIRLSGREKADDILSTVRSLARSVGVEAKNPKWTSTGSLEVDIFARSGPDFELFIEAIRPLARLDFSKDLNIAPPFRPEKELIEEARQYFDSERYWECHEVLEGIWRTKAGEEKSLLQGIILVCAAFVHHQKKEPEVALGVLRRALPQLVYRDDVYNEIDVPALKSRAEQILATGRWVNFSI